MKSIEQIARELQDKRAQEDRANATERDDAERKRLALEAFMQHLADRWKHIVALIEDSIKSSNAELAKARISLSFDDETYSESVVAGFGHVKVNEITKVVDTNVRLRLRLSKDGQFMFEIVHLSGKAMDQAKVYPVDEVEDLTVERWMLAFVNAIYDI